ncbi:MAG: hypothetical protein J6Q67_05605, partial [Clostridia bacterium]|nr:hypothetical protein [Clostridia bacterium]
FLYHQYDHKEIVSFLEKHTSWRVDSEEEHFDCLIHHGALYLKNLTARRSHLMPEYSVMINQGVLKKSDAIQKMAEPIDKTLAKKELKMFCKYAGLSYTLTLLGAKIYSKRWW